MAQLLTWTPDLSVGIDIIDNQHKRIVEYINQLHEARIRQDKEAISQVIEELVDYTLSHFSFEESMMEEAHYRFLAPHKRVHELFVRRVAEYQQRFKLGENVEVVAGDMQNTLITWLMNHIKREDMDYGPVVRASMGDDKLKEAESESHSGWLGNALRRFFGGK
jgi:hemerythrin